MNLSKCCSLRRASLVIAIPDIVLSMILVIIGVIGLAVPVIVQCEKDQTKQRLIRFTAFLFIGAVRIVLGYYLIDGIKKEVPENLNHWLLGTWLYCGILATATVVLSIILLAFEEDTDSDLVVNFVTIYSIILSVIIFLYVSATVIMWILYKKRQRTIPYEESIVSEETIIEE